MTLSCNLIGGASLHSQSDVAQHQSRSDFAGGRQPREPRDVEAWSRSEAVLVVRPECRENVGVGEQCGATETNEARHFGGPSMSTQNEHQRGNHEKALDHPADHHRWRRCRHASPEVVDTVQSERRDKGDHRRGKETSRRLWTRVADHPALPTSSTTNSSSSGPQSKQRLAKWGRAISKRHCEPAVPACTPSSSKLSLENRNFPGVSYWPEIKLGGLERPATRR